MRYASNLKGHIHAQSTHILYFNRLNPLRQISGNKHGRAARAQSRTEPTYLERPKMADTSQADRARLTIMPGAAIVSGFLKEAAIWITAQGKVLSAAEAMLTEWTGRRREASDACSRCLRPETHASRPVERAPAE